MKYRKLRIAWSVAWGVVVVLLCVLWVRSYMGVNDYVVIRRWAFVAGEGYVSYWFAAMDWQDPSPPTIHIAIPVIVAATFASLSWLPYRFSLRTPFIATTLVAVLLGIIVWMSRAE